MNALAVKVSVMVVSALGVCSGVAAANTGINILPVSSHHDVEVTTTSTAVEDNPARIGNDDKAVKPAIGATSPVTAEPGDDNGVENEANDNPATHEVGDDNGVENEVEKHKGADDATSKVADDKVTAPTTSTTISTKGGTSGGGSGSSGSGGSGSGGGSGSSGGSGSGSSTSTGGHGGHGVDG